LIQLRDEDDLVAANISTGRLQLQIAGAQLSRRIRAQAPGLYDFEIAGVPGQGAREATVTLLVDERPFLTTSLIVAVDSSAALEGHTASGGCGLVIGDSVRPSWLAWLAIAVAVGLGRRSVGSTARAKR
jgi:hypothetical protein